VNALVLVLLLSQVTPAEPVPMSDAPAIPNDHGIILKAGEPAPMDGIMLSTDRAIGAAKRIAAAEAERDELRKAKVFPWWGALIVGVVAAGIGAGVTVAIYEGAKAKP
jgi:hypothetical protein